jgi:hypothetical protein
VSIGIGCFDEIGVPWNNAEAQRRHRDELHRRFSANDLLLAADRALGSARRAGHGQAQLLHIADVEAAKPALVPVLQVHGAERA